MYIWMNEPQGKDRCGTWAGRLACGVRGSLMKDLEGPASRRWEVVMGPSLQDVGRHKALSL